MVLSSLPERRRPAHCAKHLTGPVWSDRVRSVVQDCGSHTCGVCHTEVDWCRLDACVCRRQFFWRNGRGDLCSYRCTVCQRAPMYTEDFAYPGGVGGGSTVSMIFVVTWPSFPSPLCIHGSKKTASTTAELGIFWTPSPPTCARAIRLFIASIEAETKPTDHH